MMVTMTMVAVVEVHCWLRYIAVPCLSVIWVLRQIITETQINTEII